MPITPLNDVWLDRKLASLCTFKGKNDAVTRFACVTALVCSSLSHLITPIIPTSLTAQVNCLEIGRHLAVTPASASPCVG